MKAEVLYSSDDILGESPMWHPRRQSCFWVDIEGHSIYEYDWEDQTVQRYPVGNRVSLVVPGKGDDLIIGLQGGVARLDLVTKEVRMITVLDVNWETHRCNDGGCDSIGRLWISTTALDHAPEQGTIYSVEPDGAVVKKLEKITIPNGIVWTADQQQLFFTDSMTRKVFSSVYHVASGWLETPQIAFSVPEKSGYPDGMAMDQEGMLWIALWGGYGVGRFDPQTGEMIDSIDVPVPNVSACAFAGPDLGQLIITTAKKGMSEEDLQKYPRSGSIFIVKPGVSGVKCHSCAL